MGSNLTPQEFPSDEFDDELKPGTKLLHGQYEIEEFLNNGGFGITYLAKDSLHRVVVIKECFPESICGRNNSTVRVRSRNQAETFRTIVELFIEEARGLARLSHPNIVGVHQVFEDNETAYMAMDFVEGQDLLAIAEGPETINPEALERITLKLLDAVGFIHREGVLHRDIAPDNILLGKNNEPVLIDFGAARENVSRANSYLASLRTVKDGYSPQEFYLNNSEQHPSSDLYSLAASLYHVMSKELPVSAQRRMSAIAAGEDDPYVSIKDRVSGYSDAFLEAIDHALKVFPKDRIQSAEDWRDRIAGKKTTRGLLGSLSRPVLAVENGNILEQFEKTGAKVKDRLRSATQSKPGNDKPKSSVTASPRDRTTALQEAATNVSSSSGSSGKGLYMGVAAVAILAMVGGGAFLFTGGEDITSPTIQTAETAERAEAAVPTPTVTADASDQASRKPEQVPFFLAETSEGDVTVSSASGTLASGGTVSQPSAPVTESVASNSTAPTSFTDLLNSPATEPTPAPAPAVTESVAQITADQSNSIGEQDITSVMTGTAVSFPVSADEADPTLVALASGPFADHLEPGHRVLSVNGFPIEALADFQRVVDATTDYAVGDNVEVALGIEDPATGDVFVRTIETSARQQTMLLNGVQFETARSDEGWTTFVTSGSGSEQSDLQTGDRLVALMPTNELIDTEDAIARVLRREVQNGTTRFTFAVMRDGEMWLTEMQYAASAAN